MWIDEKPPCDGPKRVRLRGYVYRECVGLVATRAHDVGRGINREAGLVGNVSVGVIGNVADHSFDIGHDRLEHGLEVVGALFEVALIGNADDEVSRPFLTQVSRKL
jgi:hypothetical protein